MLNRSFCLSAVLCTLWAPMIAGAEKPAPELTSKTFTQAGFSYYLETPTVLPVAMPSLGLAYKMTAGNFSYGLKASANPLFFDGTPEYTRLSYTPLYSIAGLAEWHPRGRVFAFGVSPGFRYMMGSEGVLNPAATASINTIDATENFSIREFFVKPYGIYRATETVSFELGYFIPAFAVSDFSTRIVRPELAENNSPAFRSQLDRELGDFKNKINELRYYYFNLYFSIAIHI